MKDDIDEAEKPEEGLFEAVERLAKLHPLEYDRVREDEADKLGVRKKTLDDAVHKKRSQQVSEDTDEQYPELEPWPDHVEGKSLFNELVQTFNRFLALQPYQSEALALWSMFSHCIEANNIAPKLLIYSPEKRCGKTTLLEVLSGLVWKPLPASNISAAGIFRVIDSFGGTIIIDEADTFIKDNPEINGIINSGHRKTMAFVLRCDGDDHKPKRFSTWAPTVIAMIGKPRDTIVDRSILIQMKRKKPGDSAERLIYHRAEKDLKIISSKIARWKIDHFEQLQELDPITPHGLNDRAADNWRPLLAIADIIGGDCPNLARTASMVLQENEEDEENASVSVSLLSDIRDIFETEKGRTIIYTEDLLKKLEEMEERPWPEWNRGKPISAGQVAKKLKPFDIAPKKIRSTYSNARGYRLEWFQDAFDRYLSGTPEQANNNNVLSEKSPGTLSSDVPDQKGSKLLGNINCSAVPDDQGML